MKNLLFLIEEFLLSGRDYKMLIVVQIGLPRQAMVAIGYVAQ